ncbi:MAG: hypothetical protein DCC51_01170 [Anaerolineae bacterium]|nr:MAG: hypothetical protein DCC51_01170 [Anaerolineae bacterium]
MTEQVITTIEQVSTTWLTRVLRRSGALTQGEVVDVAIDSTERILSTSNRIRIAYSDDAEGQLLARLFLKTVDADMEDETFGPSEVNYYTRDYLDLAGAPIPRCYDALFSEEERRYHLLLDDLSETHIEAKHREPTLEYGLDLAEAFACLHAHRWRARRFGEFGDRLPAEEQIARFVEVARPGAGHILGEFSSELKPHWPAAIDEILRFHPAAMINRARDDNGFTLIHGDPNWNNILVPRNAGKPIYLIDRQPFDWSLTVWLGAYDLAYSLVLDWDVYKRRRHETAVLRHYYDQLLARGVADYSWEKLWDDYRLSVAICVYVAIEWCRGGINHAWTHVWLPMLQQALTACDDLNCRELWM